MCTCNISHFNKLLHCHAQVAGICPFTRARRKSYPELLLKWQLIMIQNILAKHLQCSIGCESMLLFPLCAQASTNRQFIYRANFLCDVVLLMSDQQKEFPAHKAVLASCSPYFYAMFTSFEESHQNRIVLQNIDPIALGLLLDFLYTSKIQVTEVNSQVLKVFVIHITHWLDLKSNYLS